MGVCHVIIRTAAGGSSLAWHLAPSSERVPQSVRGNWLPCEPPRAPAAGSKDEIPVGECTDQGARLA
jgi:hypothetical protein